MAETETSRSDETTLVVDAHTHVIARDHQLYPLRPHGVDLGSGRERRPADWFRVHPVTVEALLDELDGAGVDRAVLVQAFGAYGYDNGYCAHAATSHPRRTTSVCIVDPHQDDAPARLGYWVRERGVRVVRLFAIGDAQETWLSERPGLALLGAAQELGIPVVVTVGAHQLPQLARALEEFPGLAVALDHCGFPDLREGPPYRAASSLFELAPRANLRLEVSGLILRQIQQAGGRPRDFVAALAAEFGARRLLWGSDYPQTHDRSYAELVSICREAADDLGAEDRAWYLGRTAVELWPELGHHQESR